MNFKIMAATLGVIAALSVPVIVAASSPGSTAGQQGNGAGACLCAGNCTGDQLRSGDGSCGGDAEQTRTRARLQAGDRTRAEACTGQQVANQDRSQAGECTQDQTRARSGDGAGARTGDCAGDQLRTRACDGSGDGDQDQDRTRQHLRTGK